MLSILVSSEKIFAEAEVNNAVIILQKESSAEKRAGNRVSVTLGADTALLTGQASSAQSHTLHQEALTFLGSGAWNIKLSDQTVALMQRIQKDSEQLGKVAKINRGLISGNREKYFSKKAKGKKWLPIITGTDVNRYFIQDAQEFVNFEKPEGAGGSWDPQIHRASKIVVRQIGYSTVVF